MGNGVDLADVIEETRVLKRRLCLGRLELPPNEVFKQPFVHMEHFQEMRVTLERMVAEGKDGSVSEASECLDHLARIVEALSGRLERPTDEELCRRFAGGRLDVRTVLDITGWTTDELYDACSSRGVKITIV